MLTIKIIALIVRTLVCALIPLILLRKLKKKTGQKVFFPFLVGILFFTVFVSVLEALAHQRILSGTVGSFIMSKPILYGIYGGLMAGFFEETARLLAFKTVLFKKKNVQTALAYGIGHAGAEIYLLICATYLIYILISVGATSFGTETDAQIMQNVNLITVPMLGVAVFERISAVMLHMGLSVFMFTAVKRKGCMALYPASILLHAVADFPAALYQTGIIGIPVTEGLIFVFSLIVLFFGMRVYKNYDLV